MSDRGCRPEVALSSSSRNRCTTPVPCPDHQQGRPWRQAFDDSLKVRRQLRRAVSGSRHLRPRGSQGHCHRLWRNCGTPCLGDGGIGRGTGRYRALRRCTDSTWVLIGIRHGRCSVRAAAPSTDLNLVRGARVFWRPVDRHGRGPRVISLIGSRGGDEIPRAPLGYPPAADHLES